MDRQEWCAKLFHRHFLHTSGRGDPIPRETVEGRKYFSEDLAKKESEEKEKPSDFKPEVCIDKHFFKKVKTPYQHPCKSIGMISGETSYGIVFGSGALIAGDLVLTCAHNCFYKHYEDNIFISQEEVQNLKFYPSPSGKIEKILWGKRAHYPEDYAETSKDKHNRYDFAVLELAEDLSHYGCFGVDSSPNNYRREKQKLILAGYPKGKQVMKDTRDASTWSVAMQWDHNEDQEMETLMEEEFLKYKILAAKGNSGSPVFKEENGEIYIVGVHIGGSEAEQYNHAVRLTARVRAIINSWVGRKGSLFLGKSVFTKAARHWKTET